MEYELKSALQPNFGLINEFKAIGYDSYRLLPGLNVLVPFDAASPSDSYLLNLFCCNAARADRLAARGVLLRSADLARVGGNDAGAAYHWRRALAHLPYAAALASAWGTADQTGTSAEVHQALSRYARSRDVALSMVERFRALEAGYLQFTGICRRIPRTCVSQAWRGWHTTSVSVPWRSMH